MFRSAKYFGGGKKHPTLIPSTLSSITRAQEVLEGANGLTLSLLDKKTLLPKYYIKKQGRRAKGFV